MLGWISRRTASNPATHALKKIVATTREPGETLDALRAQQERNPERHRGQRVPEVVDHVGEQRDAA